MLALRWHNLHSLSDVAGYRYCCCCSYCCCCFLFPVPLPPLLPFLLFSPSPSPISFLLSHFLFLFPSLPLLLPLSLSPLFSLSPPPLPSFSPYPSPLPSFSPSPTTPFLPLPPSAYQILPKWPGSASPTCCVRIFGFASFSNPFIRTVEPDKLHAPVSARNGCEIQRSEGVGHLKERKLKWLMFLMHNILGNFKTIQVKNKMIILIINK